MPASDPRHAAPWRARPHTLPLTLALACLAAVCFVLAFPPYGLWPLIALTPLLLTWLAFGATTVRRSLVVVGATQFVAWLWLDRWLIDVTPVGYPGKSAIMAVYPLLFVIVVRGAHARWPRLPAIVLTPIAWVGIETLRGEVVFDGYGWFMLAHPLIHRIELVQIADLLGTPLVSAMVAVVAGATLDIGRGIVQRRPIPAGLAVVCGLGVIVAAELYGRAQLGDVSTIQSGPRILAIQTNVAQDNKIAWTVDAQARDLATTIALTREANAATGGFADLIVWPETMLPGFGLDDETLEALRAAGQASHLEFAAAALALPEELGIPIVYGSMSYEGLRVDEEAARWEWDKQYNSAVMVNPLRELTRVDKIFLTPFGEVMPYISAWPWLEQKLLALGAGGMSFTLDAGRRVERIRVPFAEGVATLAVPICFEDTMARVCRRQIVAGGKKRADVLLNLSNDGWFADHDAGRAQHLQIARFRAIEHRVSMVRAVNTGFSVAVDSCGRIEETILDGPYGRPRRAGWVMANLSVDSRSTLYGRFGGLLGWFCLGAFLLLWVGMLFSRHPDRPRMLNRTVETGVGRPAKSPPTGGPSSKHEAASQRPPRR